ncbi:hypothetical protein BCR34DRAFT_385554 [Clohesyomyces aquaticus]|uniref:Uncharacterized protein n=1 Tax=Clohesyomyces aquaticus TaxID=1231657 RepID=A0A1Y1ZFT9_9PLEO|nr:hypothetical protein BCR34DRAFT_385554 [Clohesyomyces aquaticus]
MSTLEVGDKERVNNGLLSVAFKPTPERSSSPASSARTRVSESPSEERIEPIKRRQTQAVEIEDISWVQCLKALWSRSGRKKLKQQILSGLRIEDVPEPPDKDFIKTECPYIVTVSVYPVDKASDPIEARCTLDTGCLQGNIISAKLAQRLGFVEYRPLSERESTGATLLTGNIHTAKGAVLVTWHHFTSTKFFHDMRFLVTESENVDLIIGTASIIKHNLIPPPNLGVGVGGATDLNVPSKPAREKLVGDVARLTTEEKNAQRSLNAAIKANSSDQNDKKKRLHKKQKEKRIAELKLAIYDANKLLEGKNKPEEMKAIKTQIATLQEELDAKEKKHSKPQGNKAAKL